MATMATSVKLTEKLIHTLRQKGVQTIEIGGFSLGAVITNRHRVAYNSADFYVPIVGTVAHEKFFIFPKKKATESEIERNKIITHHLKFLSPMARKSIPQCISSDGSDVHIFCLFFISKKRTTIKT